MDTKNENSRFVTPSAQRLATGLAVLLFIWIGLSHAGITGNGIASGRITQFGSIIVNNREFDIAGANIVIDGQPAAEADLKLGQTIFVRGVVDDDVDGLPVGVADEVVASTDIEGQITAIDSDAMQLTVLGKIAFANAETIVETLAGNDAFENLAIGNRVSVSGFRRSDDSLLASRIEETAQGNDNRIVGTVENLSATLFEIDNLVIDFSIAELIGFAGGTILVGDNVRVRSASFGNNGELLASKVEFIPAISGVGQEVGEFEGFVAEFISASEFSVGGVPVLTNAGTVFIGGGPANLTTDTDVTVSGDFNAAGQLVAADVTIRGTQIRVNGLVNASSDPSLTVLGVSLIADPETRIKDSSDARVRPFGVFNIAAGDYVETRSFKDPAFSTPVVVQRIKRDDEEDDFRLDGFVSFVNASTINVLGATVRFSDDTEFSDANDNEITPTEFFNALILGTFVQVKGDASSTASVTASDISFELHD